MLVGQGRAVGGEAMVVVGLAVTVGTAGRISAANGSP